MSRGYPSAHHPVQVPTLGNALELVLAGVLENETGPCDEVLDGGRDEDLGGSGERTDPHADVNRDAPNLIAIERDLASVKPRSDLDSDRSHRFGDGLSAPHASGRTVERGQE